MVSHTHHDKESVLLPFHPIWWMSDQPCHRSPSTQAAQYCRLFWICLEQTITLCLRLNTARFPAYLIAECSSFLVIWWHTPVMAYVFAVMLLHKLQWELNKNHWLFLLLVLSTGGKACLSFSLFFHLSILSFTKRSCKCFFCTGYWWIKAPGFVTALIAAVCEGSAVQSSSHRYGGSAGDIEMEKQRPREKICTTHAFFGQILPCCEQRIQRLQFLMDSSCCPRCCAHFGLLLLCLPHRYVRRVKKHFMDRRSSVKMWPVVSSKVMSIIANTRNSGPGMKGSAKLRRTAV